MEKTLEPTVQRLLKKLRTMKNTILILFVFPCVLLAQQKSATPLPTQNSNPKTQNSTRAVVVGISDYQSPQIPDLRFADRDAAAFADWLRSPAGGSVPEANLQVLLNSDATAGKIIAALGGLVADCKPGDVAVIYFSGHGDVERISKYQRGFWLSWDSPPAVYAAGACALGYLQDIISTLSETGVQVVVVADACRAGKLAGSAVGGAQATSAALAQQFANEVKILSCQPEEYSLEGEQWGGGRGAFSFHLVDALYGMADANTDGTVNLLELGRYLEDRVPAETAPHSQIPFTVGGKATPIARVDAAQLAAWKKQKAGTAPAFEKIDSKGLEDLALADADSSVQALYREFLAALKRGDLLVARDGVSPSADTLYKQLIREPTLADLHGLMTRNFAAALMDEGQQILNQYLSGDMRAFEKLESDAINHRLLADQFYRAAELLGEKHYYYPKVKAKGLYFESYAVMSPGIPRDSARKLDIQYMRQAVALDPSASYIWFNLAYVLPVDSIEFYIERLDELAPNWPIWHYGVGFILTQTQPERAVSFFQKALELDKDFLPAYYEITKPLIRLGKMEEVSRYRELAIHAANRKLEKDSMALSTYDWQAIFESLYSLGRFDEVESTAKRFISLYPTNMYGWMALGDLYLKLGRFDEADAALAKCIEKDSTDALMWYVIGKTYSDRYRHTEAIRMLKKAILLDSTSLQAWRYLSLEYLRTQQYDEAEAACLHILRQDSSYTTAWLNLGFALIHTGRYPESESALQRAISLNPKSANAHKHLASLHFRAGRREEARQGFEKVLDLNPNYNGGYLGMAYLHAADGKTAEALEFVEQAILKNATLEQLETDDDLAPLRALPEWTALMKKHFPDKVKN